MLVCRFPLKKQGCKRRLRKKEEEEKSYEPVSFSPALCLSCNSTVPLHRDQGLHSVSHLLIPYKAKINLLNSYSKENYPTI